jgi:hypothetical protein
VALVIGGTPFFESWPHGRESSLAVELRNLGAAALDENSQHDREKYTGYNLDEGDAIHVNLLSSATVLI